MMSKVGIGLIGAGYMGETHSEAFSKVQDVELIAVTDVVKEKGKKLAEKYGMTFYPDYRDLLKRDDVNAVIICTPHALHKEQGVLAAEEGKHLLIEKPLATTVEECDEVIRASRKNGVNLMVGHVLRFLEPCVKAKELIDEGEIGDIIMTQDLNFGRGIWGDLPRPWLLEKKSSGGGIFMFIGVHQVDRLRWYLEDEAEEVYAKVGTYTFEIDVEDNGIIFLKFKKGVSSIIQSSISSKGVSTNCLKMFGTEGIIEVTYDGVRLGKEEWTAIIQGDYWTDYRKPAFLAQAKEFIDSIKNDREPKITGEDGRASVEVITAAYESSEEGRPIRIG
ncbi:MAG: Gfo/Idh/MocA family oxidoreductase [Candidatus Bathyarchaeia archaeon]